MSSLYGSTPSKTKKEESGIFRDAVAGAPNASSGAPVSLVSFEDEDAPPFGRNKPRATGRASYPPEVAAALLRARSCSVGSVAEDSTAMNHHTTTSTPLPSPSSSTTNILPSAFSYEANLSAFASPRRSSEAVPSGSEGFAPKNRVLPNQVNTAPDALSQQTTSRVNNSTAMNNDNDAISLIPAVPVYSKKHRLLVRKGTMA